jgi:hypothetical protein
LELTASSSALFLPSKIEKNVISLSCCKGNTKIVFLRRAAPIIEALLGKEKRTFWEDEKRDEPVKIPWALRSHTGTRLDG